MAIDPSVDVGTRLIGYVDPQAANQFATVATDNPVAADAVRLLDANLSGKAPFRFKRDMRGTATKAGKIDQKRTGSWQLDLVLNTSGVIGTPPDWVDLLLNQMQTIAGGAATTESGGTSTTTRVDVVASGGAAVNGCALVNGELRRITAVDSVGTDVVVTPALSAAPGSGDVVAFGDSFFFDDDAANTQQALTIWAFNNRTADRVIGAIVESVSIQMGRDEEATITFGGPARRHDRFAATALDGGINNIVTTVAVDNGLAAPQDVSAASPFYLLVGTEVLKVIGVSGNNLTVDTRGVFLGGGAAASHSDGDVVYPWQPTAGTFAAAEAPVPSTGGDLIINGVNVAATELGVDLACNHSLREGEHGDAYNLTGYAPRNGADGRECKIGATGFLYNDTGSDRALEAANRNAVQVFAQQGDTSGAVFAVEFPSMRLEESDIQRGAEQLTYQFAGIGESSTAEQEFFLLIG